MARLCRTRHTATQLLGWRAESTGVGAPLAISRSAGAEWTPSNEFIDPNIKCFIGNVLSLVAGNTYKYITKWCYIFHLA